MEFTTPENCNSPMDDLNHLFYCYGEHKCMFDKDNILLMLKEVGFTDVSFRDFDEDLDSIIRRPQSMYLFGTK